MPFGRNPVTRDEALAILDEYIENQNLKRHMYAVEAAMIDYARRLGEDAEAWGLAGLLHDFDWEIHPTLGEHPQAGAPILRARGVPEIVVRCILSHADHTGIPRETRMEKALYACDELTGLIVAVCLVRPSKSLADLTVSSIEKKWGNARFAAAVDRHEIEQGSAELGIPLWTHVANVLSSMQGIATQIGLK
jgi:putative nucleotidyltransferase with HDIG domain